MILVLSVCMTQPTNNVHCAQLHMQWWEMLLYSKAVAELAQQYDGIIVSIIWILLLILSMAPYESRLAAQSRRFIVL